MILNCEGLGQEKILNNIVSDVSISTSFEAAVDGCCK